MVVYADILFLVNFCVDALLLHAVGRFLHLPLSRLRWLLSAALGGVFGFCALLPRLSGLPLLFLSAAEAFGLIFSAFWPKRGALLRGTFLLFLFAAALSGLLGLLQRILSPPGMLIVNGSVYFDLSPLLLVLLTCIAYGALWVFDRLFRKKEPDALLCTLCITHRGETVTLTAKCDTGLTLREPFSGDPVLLAERAVLKAMLPPDFGEAACAVPCRPIVCRTVGGSALLPAFRPERLCINNVPVRAWVAVSPRALAAGEIRALIHPEALPKT